MYLYRRIASFSIVQRFRSQNQQSTSMNIATSDHASHIQKRVVNTESNPLLSKDPDTISTTSSSLPPFSSPQNGAVPLKHQPFLMDQSILESDWISRLELKTVTKIAHDDLLKTGKRLRILILYGSLQKRYGRPLRLSFSRVISYRRSYSKLLAFEAARIFHRLTCDVRVYDPAGLPVKDDVQHSHPKVVELRELSRWSDGHFWVSPEQHGNLVRQKHMS